MKKGFVAEHPVGCSNLGIAQRLCHGRGLRAPQGGLRKISGRRTDLDSRSTSNQSISAQYQPEVGCQPRKAWCVCHSVAKVHEAGSKEGTGYGAYLLCCHLDVWTGVPMCMSRRAEALPHACQKRRDARRADVTVRVGLQCIFLMPHGSHHGLSDKP